MKNLNAQKIDSITAADIQGLLVKRETSASLKKRLKSLEVEIQDLEGLIVKALESGSENDSGFGLLVNTIERRYPSWKAHYAEIAGAEAAENVLRFTKPTIKKSLVVK